MSRTKTLRSRLMQVAIENELISLLPTLLANATITVNGTSLPMSAVIAKLKAHVAAIVNTNTLRLQEHDAVVAEEALRVVAFAAIAAIKAYAAGLFGKNSPQYNALGFGSAKPTPATPAVKAAAAVKTKATRAARGIIGPVARSKIKAPVAGEPGAAPAAPTAPTSAAPAGSAGSTGGGTTGK